MFSHLIPSVALDTRDLASLCATFAEKRAKPEVEGAVAYLASDDALPVSGEFKDEEIVEMVRKEHQEEGAADDSSSDGENEDSPCRISHHEAVQHLEALTRYLNEHVPGPDTVQLLRRLQKLLRWGMLHSVKQRTLDTFMDSRIARRTAADQLRDLEEDRKQEEAERKAAEEQEQESDAEEESEPAPSRLKRLRAEHDPDAT
jgi:hypothetical protein